VVLELVAEVVRMEEMMELVLSSLIVLLSCDRSPLSIELSRRTDYKTQTCQRDVKESSY
jgi:hypothetical protein